jgi:hypothetical protein
MIAGAAVLHAKAVVSDRCDATACDSEGHEAAERGKTFSVISTVTTAVGITGLGISAYMLLRTPSSKGASVGWTLTGSF